MKKFFNWHQKFTEKKRLYYRVTHYQSYWLSWLKGIVMGFLVGFFIMHSKETLIGSYSTITTTI